MENTSIEPLRVENPMNLKKILDLNEENNVSVEKEDFGGRQDSGSCKFVRKNMGVNDPILNDFSFVCVQFMFVKNFKMLFIFI